MASTLAKDSHSTGPVALSKSLKLPGRRNLDCEAKPLLVRNSRNCREPRLQVHMQQLRWEIEKSRRRSIVYSIYSIYSHIIFNLYGAVMGGGCSIPLRTFSALSSGCGSTFMSVAHQDGRDEQWSEIKNSKANQGFQCTVAAESLLVNFLAHKGPAMEDFT